MPNTANPGSGSEPSPTAVANIQPPAAITASPAKNIAIPGRSLAFRSRTTGAGIRTTLSVVALMAPPLSIE
ncbi:hypothetical protein Lesp02_62270 [Lentzea sp. NBRC 105346]|nr:hypothetical protein Lesp02_62270 [Lentzea sp. NBRC 105346]